MDYKELTGKALVAEAKLRGIEIPVGTKASELRAMLIASDEETRLLVVNNVEPLLDTEDEQTDGDEADPDEDSEAGVTTEDDDEPTDTNDEDEEGEEAKTQEDYSSMKGAELLAESKSRNLTIPKGIKASELRALLIADDNRDPDAFDASEIPEYIQSLDGFDLEEVLSRIVSVDDDQHYIKAVFYGDNGTGKTTLAATFPNVVIVDANEKGTESVKGTGAKKFELKGWADLYGIYWYLKSGKHSFETVVIDTMTQLEDMCLRYVMDKDMESDSTRSPEMAKIQDYGRRALLMKSWTIYFRDLPMNVIFLVQKGSSSEETQEDETEVYPMLSDKIRKCLCGAVSIIGYTYKKEKSVPSKTDPNKLIPKTNYCLRVGPSERYLTKIRVPKGQKYKPVLVDPTYDKLINISNIKEGN